MTERPILFNGEMVSAILDGRKTETRRAIQPAKRGPDINFELHQKDDGSWQPYHTFDESSFDRNGTEHPVACPYGQPGDRLWVRETWAPGATQTMYRAGCSPDYLPPDGKWRPSIHMPRWASRILLEVTDVRVERLQEITIGQICKEGLARSMYEFIPVTTAFDAFAELWNSTGGDWDADPWVWVVEFKRIDQ